MSRSLKNIGYLTSIVIELIGVLLILMQYKILSQDVFVLATGILVGGLMIFGVATFFKAFIHNVMDDEQPTCIHHQNKLRIIIFWVFLISSFVMMIITNVLAFVGFNYDSVGVLCSMVIWGVCAVVVGIMDLFDIVSIDGEAEQRKGRLKKINESFFKPEV